jgi:hypothetical protein
VRLAAEPVKTTLRRAQTRRAVLTEPAASRNPIFLIRGNGSTGIRYRGHFYWGKEGDISNEARHSFVTLLTSWQVKCTMMSKEGIRCTENQHLW